MEARSGQNPQANASFCGLEFFVSEAAIRAPILASPNEVKMPRLRRFPWPLENGNRRSTEKLPVLQGYGPIEQAFSLALPVHPLAQELLGPTM
jgi:hypothetical protein